MAYSAPETIGDKLKIIGKTLKLINLGVVQVFTGFHGAYNSAASAFISCDSMAKRIGIG